MRAMHYRRFSFLLVFLFCFSKTSVFAQESLVMDISPEYVARLITLARENYPKVKAFDKRVDKAAFMLKKDRMSWFEVFNFFYLYSPNNSTTLVNPNLLNGYQIGVNLNIGALLQKKPQINMSKQDLEVAKLEKAEYELQLATEVKSRYYTYLQQQQVLKMRRQVSLDVEAVLKQTKYKFEKGEETFENYNRSLMLMAENRQRITEAEAALLTAKSRLEELIGVTLESVN
jgi:outer membrane protein TolC